MKYMYIVNISENCMREDSVICFRLSNLADRFERLVGIESVLGKIIWVLLKGGIGESYLLLERCKVEG